MKTRWGRRALIALWGLAALSAFAAWRRSGVPLRELPHALRSVVAAAGPWGPVLFLGLFVARAFTFAPASPFVLAAGLVWGPAWGTFWAVVGINISAWVAYWLAAWLGRDWVASHEGAMMARVEERLRAAPFLSSMILRMIFIPFDPVNYACGMLGIPFLPYVAGTALGTLPGVATFALFGSAWHDPRALGASVVVLGLSL
ncbi:MAG: TVP38/TMEM64 family protein, partial [Elusimicrobia bacterium]|nr:TVP38/TMEM64 family protein [Elusimicrobiota bacterium]